MSEQQRTALAFATAEFIETYLYEEDQPLVTCYELHKELLSKFIEINRFKPFFGAEKLSRYKSTFFNSEVCNVAELEKARKPLSIEAIELLNSFNRGLIKSAFPSTTHDLRVFTASGFALVMLLNG